MPSQFLEDVLTLRLVEQLDPPKTFVEIGCGDGEENCTRVLVDRGWGGVWVDADTRCIKKAAQAVRTRADVFVVQRRVTVHNLDKLRVPRQIGVLSIDIDGNDYWVWKRSFEIGWRPWIVIIEAQLWNAPDYIMPYNENYRWTHELGDYTPGAGPEAMKALGRSFGYTYYGKDPNIHSPNLFFVRDDLLPRLSDDQEPGDDQG